MQSPLYLLMLISIFYVSINMTQLRIQLTFESRFVIIFTVTILSKVLSLDEREKKWKKNSRPYLRSA